MDSDLVLDRLTKSFGGLRVADAISLAVSRGETLALLGPSGSGKTTVLRMIAGFEEPDSGTVSVGGDDVTRQPPERRRFGMVFQHYALFPHLTVGQNVAFGLESQGVSRDEVNRRVAEALAAVDLPGFAPRRVHEISGGQQQRVALARALAPRPRVLLLDEPLSNLDPQLRERTRRELARTLAKIGITAVFVTHEQEEAFDLGRRVAVLNGGRLEQVGTPEELYRSPATRFVATFIGRASVLPAAWQASGTARLDGGPAWRADAVGPLAEGQAVDLVVRPEAVTFAAGPGSIAGTVTARRFAGREAFYDVETGVGTLEVLSPPDAAKIGDTVSLSQAPAAPLPRAYPRTA
jgi:ABC-type Fe3+/spermidine/putrescine transport system ATPase subunit